MTGIARRAVPLLLAGVAVPALALTGCARATPGAPAVSVARTSPQPELAGARAGIPNAARQVTLSLDYGRNAHGRRPPVPVTITDPARVGGLVGLVTRLPPWPPGTYNCPGGDGMALHLAFRAHPADPPLASADLALNGCEGTYLTVGGKDYTLGHPGSARRFADKVLRVAGVRWKLPPFYWPGT
jgi:hypothetical protein